MDSPEKPQRLAAVDLGSHTFSNGLFHPNKNHSGEGSR